MISTTLGRGGPDRLVFSDREVSKRAPLWEPVIMDTYPEVFVPVLGYTDLETTGPLGREPWVWFRMPRLRPPALYELEPALFTGLACLHDLWRVENPTINGSWRYHLGLHLEGRIRRNGLDVDIDFMHSIVEKLPEPNRPWRQIHGDATLANLVHGPNDADIVTWQWIDPLDRGFIPGDPHVDLGKMYQSCWGYEATLFGSTNAPKFDTILARKLAHRSHLSYEVGRLWAVIHLIRLLPYQDERVKVVYAQVLRDEQNGHL